MKIAGIVAEYNPFHNGHAYHIAATKAAGSTHIVAVMGGLFLQRGAPALLDKKYRVEAALHHGVDLVVELPLPYAMAVSERFAFGAVATLAALGCVDMLSFGSEAGDIAPLAQAVKWIEDPRVTARLQSYLGKGVTFAAARQKAVEAVAGSAIGKLLESPNNILGIEYMRKLAALNTPIQPFTLRRQGAGHDAPLGAHPFASASAIRALVEAGDIAAALALVPPAMADALQKAMQRGEAPILLKRVELAVLSSLRRLSPEELARLPDLSEGLEHKLYTAIRKATTLEELYVLCKSKRYPLARLRRLVLSAFLGVDGALCRRLPPYIRVLGVGPGGAQVLAEAKKNAVLPLSHSLAKLEALGGDAALFAKLEASAADQYALMQPVASVCGGEYTRRMVKIEE